MEMALIVKLVVHNDSAYVNVPSVFGSICTFRNYLTNQVHSHTETALDTSKMKGTRSSFPVKMHLVPDKPSARIP